MADPVITVPYSKYEKPEDLEVTPIFNSVEEMHAEQERWLRLMIGDRLFEYLERHEKTHKQC